MDKEFYLKVKFPEGREMGHLQLEELIYFALKDALDVESDDFKELDVTCSHIKFAPGSGDKNNRMDPLIFQGAAPW